MRYIEGQGYRAKLEANRCVILKVRATEPSWKQVCFITGQGYRAKLEANRCVILKVRATAPSWKQTGALY